MEYQEVYVCELGGVYEIKFRFQSELMKQRFLERKEEHQQELEQSLSKRFTARVKVEKWFADMVLYHRLNRLFFDVEVGGKSYTNMTEISAYLT